MADMQGDMMRIAIAGSGGLARMFAQYIYETIHEVVILTRQARPELELLGYTVIVTDYDNQEDLRYTLRGVDLVISTISGTPQINLIDAAARSRVRRFVPAEFEGRPERRPANDPLDRGRAACLERLRHYSNHQRHPMASTVFVCGVFYERFARGGLGSLGIGSSANLWSQGSYLMDVEASTAEIVEVNTAGQPIYISMTSVNDLSRFIVAALNLDLTTWSREFRVQGDRRTVSEIVQWAEAIKGGTAFDIEVIAPGDLRAHLEYAVYYSDWPKVSRIQELMATEARLYDFTQPNHNTLMNIEPESLWNWLRRNWGAQ